MGDGREVIHPMLVAQSNRLWQEGSIPVPLLILIRLVVCGNGVDVVVAAAIVVDIGEISRVGWYSIGKMSLKGVVVVVGCDGQWGAMHH